MNIWPEAKLWHPMPWDPWGHPWGVGWVLCYPNTLLERREEITWEEELPLAAVVCSHGHSGLYTRKWRLIFGGQVMANGLGGAMGETAACLSLCKWFRSAERGYDLDHELRAEQTTHLYAASSSSSSFGKRAGNKRIQIPCASPFGRWTTFCLVPQLVSGSAAEQIYPTWCSQECTIMRAKQALHFRDVCMLRRSWKHKSGQQTCKSLLCIPSILLASFSSLTYFYLLCPALFGNSSNCHLRWQMSFASVPLPS